MIGLGLHQNNTMKWTISRVNPNPTNKIFKNFLHSFQTPFVRQNTPHPKELKLKAHKLFAKEKGAKDESGNLDTLSEEVNKFEFLRIECA